MSHARCPYCECDEEASEPAHGPNCPRYRGPAWSGVVTREEFDELGERVMRLEARLDKEPRVLFSGDVLIFGTRYPVVAQTVDGALRIYVNHVLARPEVP